jgi:hypothetical protein
VGILNAEHRAGLYCAALCLLSVASLKADSLCFEYSGYYRSFGTVDLDTGAISGAYPPLGNDIGLGVYGGSLYTANTGVLFTVNTAGPSVSPPAANNFGVRMVDLGSTLSGLYGLGWDQLTNDDSSQSDLGLYSIDPSTGLAALVGLTELSYSTFPDIGLSTNSDTLYFGDGNELYTIATTTGAVTDVGSFGGAGSYQMGALVVINGVLYGADINNHTVDTINPFTGAATPGATINLVIYGLAPNPLPSGGPEAEEPGTWTLLAAGAVGLMAAKRKMRDRRTFAMR